MNHREQIRLRRRRDGLSGARKEEAEPSNGGRCRHLCIVHIARLHRHVEIGEADGKAVGDKVADEDEKDEQEEHHESGAHAGIAEGRL